MKAFHSFLNIDKKVKGRNSKNEKENKSKNNNSMYSIIDPVLDRVWTV